MKDVLSSIRRRLPTRLRELIGCTDGSSAVEFAILLPVYITLLIGMFEVAWIMYIQSAIEGALRQSARYGITGQGASPTDRTNQIIALMNEYTFGSVDVTAGMIEEKVYSSFQNVGTPEPWTDQAGHPNPGDPPNGKYDVGEPYTEVNGIAGWQDDQGVAGAGNSGDVVRYRVRYDLHPLTGFVQGLVGTIPLQATTVVKNEPYSGG